MEEIRFLRFSSTDGITADGTYHVHPLIPAAQSPPNINSSTKSSNSFYLGVIQMLEQTIKSKRKTTISKNNKSLISVKEDLELIQNEHTKNLDSDINLQQISNNEQKDDTKNENCFPNKDECYDDINVSSNGNLNSKFSLSHLHTSLCASEDETLDILNTFDTGKAECKEDLFNLKEAERKNAVSDLTQVDKYPYRHFNVNMLQIFSLHIILNVVYP